MKMPSRTRIGGLAAQVVINLFPTSSISFSESMASIASKTEDIL